ncbi:MAG TPA: glycosyltransferase family 87 protein, partial [Gemmata sp.]|nr:glycosyltransferase family 87 protein [Gemmata sp.]
MPNPTANAPLLKPRWWPIRGAIVAVAIFSFCSFSVAIEAKTLPQLFPSQTPDFFIIRSGAVIALQGESPYEPEIVQRMVAEQFPKDKQLIENSAFFLPPATIAIYAPLAVLPYPIAKVAWAIVLALSSIAVLQAFRIFGSQWPISATEQLLPAIVLLNYLTLAIVELGQTSMLFVGCVVAGQWCFERGRSFTSGWWP